MLETEFWKKKSLEEMNQEEWEALCDGCARCCLYKLQDEETGEVFYTNVSCSGFCAYPTRRWPHPAITGIFPAMKKPAKCFIPMWSAACWIWKGAGVLLMPNGRSRCLPVWFWILSGCVTSSGCRKPVPIGCWQKENRWSGGIPLYREIPTRFIWQEFLCVTGLSKNRMQTWRISSPTWWIGLGKVCLNKAGAISFSG